MPSRRAFIRILGGTAVFAAATVVGLKSCDTMPAEAVAGWKGPPPEEKEPRRRALSYALLAPNPHNMQSWIADLRTPGEIALFVDTARLLPLTDPPGRQVVIGCGCFLETLVLAAASEGWAAEVSEWPDGVDEGDLGARPFARVRFSAAAASDPDGLAAAILRRRSAKVDYDGRPLAAAHEAAIRAVVTGAPARLSLTSEPATVAALRDIGTRAFRMEIDTDRVYRESVDLMRIGAREIAAHRDGLHLHGPFIWWAKQFGLLSPEAQMEKGGTARETARAMIDSAAATTASFGWIATEGNTRALQLAAGRAYQRINLAATAAGFAMAPWSQALEEFSEMAALKAEFLKTVGAAPGETVQMFFRLGYADPPPPTPRRPLDAIIRA